MIGGFHILAGYLVITGTCVAHKLPEFCENPGAILTVSRRRFRRDGRGSPSITLGQRYRT